MALIIPLCSCQFADRVLYFYPISVKGLRDDQGSQAFSAPPVTGRCLLIFLYFYNNIKGRWLNGLLRLSERLKPGSAVQCDICGWRGRRFGYLAAVSVNALEANEVCPSCKSNGRTRTLVRLLSEMTDLTEGEKTLADVGASKATRVFFPRFPQIKYLVVDRFKEADVACDITAIDLPDNSVDPLFCCHVLEHIETFRDGIRELHRILKPGHRGIVVVPQTEGLAESRLTHIHIFEGYGHIWEFGDDFALFLREAGFDVETRIISNARGEAEPFHIVRKS